MSKTFVLLEKTLIFVYFLLLPSQFSYHFWLSKSFLYGRPVDYLAPTVYFTQLISIILLTYWFIQYIVARPRIFLKISPTQIILSILITINCLLAQVPLISFYRCFALLLPIVIFLKLHQKISLSSSVITLPLSLSLIWTSILAWQQWIHQSSIGGFLYFLGERPLLLSLTTTAKVPLFNAGLLLRSYATFPHPNALAGFLLLGGLFLLLNIRKASSPKIGLLLKSAYFASLFTLPLTFSRTSFWALLTLPIIFIVFISNKPKSKKTVLILVLLSLFVISLFIPGNPTSLTDRISQYSHAFSLIGQFPVMGVGLGNYLYYSPASFLHLAHNFWLLVLVELGLLLSGFLLYKLFKFLIQIYHSKPTTIILIWPLLVTTFTDSYWYTLHQNSTLAIFLLVYLYKLTTTPPKLPK